MVCDDLRPHRRPEHAHDLLARELRNRDHCGCVPGGARHHEPVVQRLESRGGRGLGEAANVVNREHDSGTPEQRRLIAQTHERRRCRVEKRRPQLLVADPQQPWPRAANRGAEQRSRREGRSQEGSGLDGAAHFERSRRREVVHLRPDRKRLPPNAGESLRDL